jgi:dephospho-CoA kinase
MLQVGITGGIGSGKSTVAKIFTALGVPVFDADAAAKQIMETDSHVKQQIVHVFGEKAYTNNALNRKHLAAIVFTDNYYLEKLNSIVHPAAIQAADNWAKTQNAPYVLKEAALIFEAGSGKNLDYIIGVYAPDALRIKRVMEREGVLREAVLQRMSKQINQQLKMKLCNFIIRNNEKEMVIPQVLSLHKKLLELAQKN